MVRGMIPRQPAKTGRHEGARRMPKPSPPPRTYQTPPLAEIGQG